MYFRKRDRKMLDKANLRRVRGVSRNCSLKTVRGLMCHPIKRFYFSFKPKITTTILAFNHSLQKGRSLVKIVYDK